MKNNNKIVNTTLPAFIGDFKEQKQLSPNKYVTSAKLKMFYTGTTKDKRTFTKEFADKVLTTLVHSPIVGYYDEEKEDFIGHNETQHVYGFVPDSNYEIIEEDGKEWAVTNVLLFTGREDMIGKIASKIVGRQHSLELDPDSIKYSMRVEGGYLKEIIFQEGAFIGLSVVGDNQTPAFEGSTFFLSNECKEELEDIKNFLGGIKMNETKDFVITPESIVEYLEKTYGELAQEAYEKFKEMYPIASKCSYIMECGSNFIITHNFETYKYYRYSLNEIEEIEVFPKYLTAEEIALVNANKVAEVDNPIVNAVEQEGGKEKEEFIDDKDDKDDINDKDDVDDKDDKNDDEDDSLGDDFKKDDKAKCKEISEKGEGVLLDTPTFTEEDRMELEAYRNKSKEGLLEKFREFLNDEELTSYKEKIAEYTVEELKTELSVKSMDFVLAKQEQEKNAEKATINSNIFTYSNSFSREDEVKSLIDKYKDER